ncbi:hypothetical protein [Rathayibacter rathayi]|uniref:Uncharacterized protein n=1 Tax=Rathayibacter rathayi TaxID=33887 RepID=A0ABD6W868_RATRA|nr:hypothetical protein [Rathayibacter rathayi]PPF14016.1 hypothetical protein C5C04_07875 [Rathayibacter rathayi]PPF79170.1 hypothetical protein C5C14_09310 [Rathayibacter rathayi]PPG13162.1 hypothetical protein C5C11_07480 [Rathayibacter rathayi]PPG43510.1 hypothetical protein C5C20_08665 [Rathayibacter rathayi]PPI03348.1 hypothetical protein C5C43_07010 [Rathayibacter rathayi]
MHSGSRLDDAKYGAHLDEWAARVRASFGDLPLWAVCGWSGRRVLGEWIFSGAPHGLAFLGVGAVRGGAGPSVETRTTLGDPRRDVALLRGREESPISFVRPEALPAPTRIAEISVDGEQEPFEVWEGDGAVRAAASVRGHVLTLECRGVGLDRLAMAEVDDIEPSLAGWLESAGASGR